MSYFLTFIGGVAVGAGLTFGYMFVRGMANM